VDLLKRIARHSAIRVQLSVITVDRELSRRLEPRSPTPDSRLRALARLCDAGIETGVNCMPVLPGITDDPRALDELVRRVAAAGATHIGACALRLDRAARLRYLPFIEQEFPELAARYHASYSHGRDVGETYRAGLARYFVELRARYGIMERDSY
jgi:DNA repair photolyase